MKEGQTQEPVGGMKSKEEIIRDLKTLRNYFGEHDKSPHEHRLYEVADKLLKYFTSAPPSPVGIDTDWVKRYDQLRADMNMSDSINKLVTEVKAGYAASLPQSSTEEEDKLWRDMLLEYESLQGMEENTWTWIIDILKESYKISKR